MTDLFDLDNPYYLNASDVFWIMASIATLPENKQREILRLDEVEPISRLYAYVQVVAQQCGWWIEEFSEVFDVKDERYIHKLTFAIQPTDTLNSPNVQKLFDILREWLQRADMPPYEFDKPLNIFEYIRIFINEEGIIQVD